MGGSALLTNYFHSCFLHTFKEKEVSKASSSSFFSIYHDNKASGWGSIIDKQKWDTWSEIDLKLSGGNASEYGTLGQDNIMGELNVASWQSTINAHTAVPLTYTLRPITEILTDDWIDPAIAKNVLQALKDYDAEITVEMKDLETSLVEKDKYKLPSWCKAPKKPHVKKGFLTIKSLSDSSLPEITSARQLRGSQPLAQEADLPGCRPFPDPTFEGVQGQATRESERKEPRAVGHAQCSCSRSRPSVCGWRLWQPFWSRLRSRGERTARSHCRMALRRLVVQGQESSRIETMRDAVETWRKPTCGSTHPAASRLASLTKFNCSTTRPLKWKEDSKCFSTPNPTPSGTGQCTRPLLVWDSSTTPTSKSTLT